MTGLLGFLAGAAGGYTLMLAWDWLEGRMKTYKPRRLLHLIRVDGRLEVVTIETRYKTFAGRPFVIEAVLWTRPDGLTYDGELWTSGNISD